MKEPKELDMNNGDSYNHSISVTNLDDTKNVILW